MKKRIIYLFSGIILLLVSSISVTVAWFNESRQLDIDNMEINMHADADIFFSTINDYDTAKKTLSNSDFGIGDDFKFKPVSTMYSSEWLSIRADTPTFKGQYKVTESPTPSPINALPNDGYISKEIYLFSNRFMYVTVDKDHTAMTAEETKNAVTAHKIYEQEKKQAEAKGEEPPHTEAEILSGLNSVKDSLRISILDYENETHREHTIINPNEGEEVTFGGRLDTSRNDGYYESANVSGQQYEALFGEFTKEHDLVYNEPLDHDTPLVGEHSCFNAQTRAGVHGLNMDDLANNVKFAKEDAISIEQADCSNTNDESDGYLIPLEPYVGHRIVVSFYLEGWDRNNTDYTQSGSFKIDLGFKLWKESR